MQAYNSLINITWGKGGNLVKAGYSVVDILTGSHVHSDIIADLLYCERTGKGQNISTYLFEVNMYTMMSIVTIILSPNTLYLKNKFF